jgi:ketosteroid isomerase-like protein
VPVLAQQGSNLSEQDAHQAAAIHAKKFESAYNAGDGAGIAKLFTKGGVYLIPGGTVLSDPQTIEKAVEGRIKAGWTKETVTVTEAHVAGDAVWATGEYSLEGTGQSSGKPIGGHYAVILVRDGGEWHSPMLIGNLTPTQDVTGMAATSGSSAAPPK